MQLYIIPVQLRVWRNSGILRVWYWNKDGACVQVFEGHTNYACSVTMSGDTIVSGSGDKTAF